VQRTRQPAALPRLQSETGSPSMTDSQIQAKAIIAAALIQSRAIDPEAMASQNKDISAHKLAHLRELTDRIYSALSMDSSA
jgi:hypothetical protein